jgi:hypothetical protein
VTEPSTPSAGWYEDPEDPAGLRYWDGSQWTEDRAPAETPTPAIESATVETKTVETKTVETSSPVSEPPPSDTKTVETRSPAIENMMAVTTRLETTGPPGRHAKSEPQPAAAGGIKGPVWVWLAGMIAALVAVIVFVVVVFMNTHTDVKHTPSASKTSTATSAAATPSAAPTTAVPSEAGAGQEVRDGAFTFLVTGIDRRNVIADAQFPDEVKKQAQGEFLIVNMKVTNVGEAPQSYFASFNKLAAGGITYTPDDDAWVYLGNTVADINPGDSINTSVVFDVPVGTAPESIELHDVAFSNGVIVKL